MNLPTIMYRDKGSCQRPGGTYSWISVTSEDAFAEAVENWYYETLEQAIQKPRIENVYKLPTIDKLTNEETDQPTREELEQMATELGIRFDGRSTDSTLLNKINEQLGT